MFAGQRDPTYPVSIWTNKKTQFQPLSNPPTPLILPPLDATNFGTQDYLILLVTKGI